MPRYCKQRDWFRCGPLAILNALKWAGHKVTYNDMMSKLTKQTNTYPRNHPNYGTSSGKLTEILREYGFIVSRRKKMPLKELKEYVKSGGAAIVAWYWGKKSPWGHYALLVPDENSRDWCKVINMWNYQTSIAEYNLTPREKQEYLKRLSDGVWLIRKR